jgi:hypothetical protein
MPYRVAVANDPVLKAVVRLNRNSLLFTIIGAHVADRRKNKVHIITLNQYLAAT